MNSRKFRVDSAFFLCVFVNFFEMMMLCYGVCWCDEQ